MLGLEGPCCRVQVQDRGIRPRCDGALHLIDVGISRAYHGGAAFWECGGEAVGASGVALPYAVDGAGRRHPLVSHAQAEAKEAARSPGMFFHRVRNRQSSCQW
jgi:hypothetical protein